MTEKYLAYVADIDGFVLSETDLQSFLEDPEEWDGAEPSTVYLATGSALPLEKYGSLRSPGSWDSSDVVIEEDVEWYSASQIKFLFERTKLIADLLNSQGSETGQD